MKPVHIFYQKKSNFWSGQYAKALNVFYKAVDTVPAYKVFLHSQASRLRKQVKTMTDFALVPLVNKKAYFSKFSLREVSSTQQKPVGYTLTSTSGSTGSPVFFARDNRLAEHYADILEFYLGHRKSKSILYVDCFGMGIWIGGLLTFEAVNELINRGYNIAAVTPGISKKDIFSVLGRIAPQYDTVVLSGYPPFIKEVIDEMKDEGVSLPANKLRLVFAAESFTEGFRENVVATGKIQNLYLDTMNMYGSAELGAMAFETPTAILIRRLILDNPVLRDELFPDHRTPTVAQFDPRSVYFEEVDGQVAITADSYSPFVRYSIGDNGRVCTFDQLAHKLLGQGIDLAAIAKKHGIAITELPFVFVFERADFSTTIFGLQVYPQHIKTVLETKQFNHKVTGRFQLKTVFNKKNEQYLHLHLEVKKGGNINDKKLAREIQQAIVKKFTELNSEFRELLKHYSAQRIAPQITFWPYGHETYFKSGIKQKWIHKS